MNEIDKAAESIVRILDKRNELITFCLDERRKTIKDIEKLGGFAAPDAFVAIREKEERLRELENALGVLRYGWNG